MQEMHAIDQAGSVYRGVDAFWAIWQAFPAGSIYGFLGRSITLPLVNQTARMAYQVFARNRKYLPKRPSDCADSHCRSDRF
jgi:predicted DCC family thiol-disulfide oxidoreductase YuxK